MIQIDMDMPERCGLCRLFHAENPMHCMATSGFRFKCVGAPYGMPRPDWCPLKEVKHGKWDIEISHDGYQATYRCSECGHQFKWLYDPHFPPVFNYCQKCGAYMRTDG